MICFKKFMVLAILILVGFNIHAKENNSSNPKILFILDASGSMAGKTGKQSKMNSAKSVMNKVITDLPKDIDIGLISYGHRKAGDCGDIELVMPTHKSNRDVILSHIDKLNPKGKTPLADSIKQAVSHISTKNQVSIVLLSDGEESCGKKPCDVVKQLKSQYPDFVLHVVGFDVNKKQAKQLSCIAQAGGGQYFSADNSDALLKAMQKIVKKSTEKGFFYKYGLYIVLLLVVLLLFFWIFRRKSL